MRLVLTAQQARLMEGLAHGLALKEIAAQLGISEGTAKVYMYKARIKNGGITNCRMLYLWGLQQTTPAPETLLSFQRAAREAIHRRHAA